MMMHSNFTSFYVEKASKLELLHKLVLNHTYKFILILYYFISLIKLKRKSFKARILLDLIWGVFG
jgi:hypothetical protein